MDVLKVCKRCLKSVMSLRAQRSTRHDRFFRQPLCVVDITCFEQYDYGADQAFDVQIAVQLVGI